MVYLKTKKRRAGKDGSREIPVIVSPRGIRFLHDRRQSPGVPRRRGILYAA